MNYNLCQRFKFQSNEPISNEVISCVTVKHEENSVTERITTFPDQVMNEEEEFRPAEEVFRDPSALDFLMQHGGPSHGTALSRQSLFVKFDPLVGGRPSMFPPRQPDAGISS